MTEGGGARAWVLAFVASAGLGIGTLVGVGCAVKANVCPFRERKALTTLDGETLWLANCAFCHGRDGAGTDDAPPLVSGRLASLPLAELEGRIARGRRLAGMPKFEGVLSQAQIRAVAEHVVGLRERAGRAS